MCGIYKITNKSNGKAYVGQSICIKTRWKQHKCDAFNPKDPGYEYPLYRAFRKYGLRNFKFEVLEECSVSQLDEKEIYYIAFYDTYYNGYNQDKGGHGASHFIKLSDELVDEIIAILKVSKENSDTIGEKFGVSGSTIRKINTGESCYRENETYPIRHPIWTSDRPDNFCIVCGVRINRAAKCYCPKCSQIAQRRVERPEPLELAKMVKEFGFTEVGRQLGVDGNAVKKWCKQYGVPRRREELITWYNERMGLPATDIPKRNSTLKMPVEQIDPATNKVVATYTGVMDAARALGKTNGNQISKACNGKSPMAYGYLWRFASPPSTSNPAA